MASMVVDFGLRYPSPLGRQTRQACERSATLSCGSCPRSRRSSVAPSSSASNGAASRDANAPRAPVMAPSTISRSATQGCVHKWITSRRSFTNKRRSSSPTITEPARSWRRSARSTANCSADARRFRGSPCSRQLPASAQRPMSDWAACSSPICSQPGWMAILRFCVARRRLMNPKIQEHHRSKPAYIYLRQSTPSQVRHHQESTERQYALREKALELGWSESLIRTLDRDLGKTGTEMARREDFKTLVAEVSMGQVGAVFALEVSRLARSNLDWHRLLELCAFTETLVIDEDGCYDPADFNDGLLLGLKGAMAQAELHFLHARLQGGKLNKAKKGELRFPLPVGYCYDEQDCIVPDPDEEVRGAVGLVFRLFRETGSAYAVMQRFVQGALRFPKRAYGGAWDGKIVWGRLSHSRVLGMLKNPSYAGMYVFGRYQYRREISAEGAVHKRTHAVAMAEWRV